MSPKYADGMANSVDPDQTASSEKLFAETYLSQYIKFVRYYYYYFLFLLFVPQLLNQSAIVRALMKGVIRLLWLPAVKRF